MNRLEIILPVTVSCDYRFEQTNGATIDIMSANTLETYAVETGFICLMKFGHVIGTTKNIA